MPTKSRGRTAKALPKTKTFNGKRYTKTSCSTSKPNSKKKAAAHRKAGKKKFARVEYDAKNKTHCVYTRG